jgi:hypothetical protein
MLQCTTENRCTIFASLTTDIAFLAVWVNFSGGEKGEIVAKLLGFTCFILPS